MIPTDEAGLIRGGQREVRMLTERIEATRKDGFLVCIIDMFPAEPSGLK